MDSRAARETFDALRRDEALIVAVVSRHFPDLEKSSQYRYTVPPGRHGDSVTVYYDAAKGAWLFHRFSTGQHGDVLDVVQWYDGASGVAEALRLLDGDLPRVAVPALVLRPKHRPPPHWLDRAEKIVATAMTHPHRDRLWTAYKPLLRVSMEMFELGVGVLPGSNCGHERLLYPVRRAGRVVGLRGRRITCGCPIWLSARGSETTLWGADMLGVGNDVVCCENPVDAMLVMQTNHPTRAVATTAGAAAWRDEWTGMLVAARPRQVLVWYDNDLAGCPNGETWVSERTAYVAKHGHEPGVPAGRRLWAKLVEAHLPAELYAWPSGTHVHADVGEVLTGYWRPTEVTA